MCRIVNPIMAIPPIIKESNVFPERYPKNTLSILWDRLFISLDNFLDKNVSKTSLANLWKYSLFPKKNIEKIREKIKLIIFAVTPKNWPIKKENSCCKKIRVFCCRSKSSFKMLTSFKNGRRCLYLPTESSKTEIYFG